MKNRLRKLKIASYIVFGIEFFAIIFFGICYFNNYFGTYDLIPEKGLFAILSVVIMINVLWLFFIMAYSEIIRKNSDLKIADLIGQDVKEAYNFGMIGLAVTDEEGIVLWVNDLFKERQIDILDENIIEWQPSLEELQHGGSNSTAKVLINARTYEAKFLKDAGLYIFRDITDLETVSTFSRKQSTVVGQIVIDNYSDLSDSGDDTSDIIAEVRNLISDYCKEHNVLLRKTRNDAYFILCNYESLEEMEADKFSLLEEVRKLGQKEIIPPTISVGIAYDFPGVTKLNEMAGNAIEIAMSRGGDQVVVSQYGEELEFYGGKTVAIENRNKVKVRVMADSVLALIANSSNVIIMGHAMMDMDALGACLGIKAMCDHSQKDAIIVYDPKNTERKAKSVITTYLSKNGASYFVNESKALNEIRSNTLVVVCDVHKPKMVMAPKVLEKATKVMVIDHHRRGEEFIESPIFANVDPSSSSTSEIVAELIYYASANPRISLPEDSATVMLSGIFLDSNYFKNSASGSKTFEASMILKEFGANNSLADDFLKDEFEEHALINKIVSTLKTPHYGVVYCVSENDDIIESATLAKVANQCMEMKGVEACFVIGRTGVDEVKISCRSNGSINVQIIAEKLNGGGHFTQAACVFNKSTVAQAETKLLNTLNEHLSDAKAGGALDESNFITRR